MVVTLSLQKVVCIVLSVCVALGCIATIVVVAVVTSRSSGLQLKILHLNDFHARFEETSTTSGTCKSDNCIGGFSRVYTRINELYDKDTTILLNAGDNFQGTLWYNLFKWNVTQYFLNMLPTDVYTLGNHEFDDQIAGVVPFIKALNAPTVVCNIDDSLEPDIQGLYEKSTIIERDGKKIGIVGVILSTTNTIASTGKLAFLDESDSVNDEAKRLLDEEGVFTVIVLSHSGYEVDQRIAKNAIPGISVIVGAHSHTLLYSGTPPFGTAYGDYPTVVESVNGDEVLVVQAHAYTTYLGHLNVEYDSDGKLIDWDGNPIHLSNDVPQDAEINELLEPYRLEVEEAGGIVLGESKVYLDSSCRYVECNLGNLIADAMVAHYATYSTDDTWTSAPIGIINAGGIRTSINKGELTYNDLATVIPFENTIDRAELQGKYIKAFMETAASPYNTQRVYADINLIQVSGIRAVIDVSQPLGSRVTSLKVRCHQCSIPAYEEIDLEKYYPMAVLSFLVTGGDGYTEISDNLVNYTIGPVDIDVVSKYVSQQSPVIVGLDERITVVGIQEELRVIYHG